MKDKIEKYLNRIMVDYPEADKIYIDLKQAMEQAAELYRLESLKGLLEEVRFASNQMASQVGQ